MDAVTLIYLGVIFVGGVGAVVVVARSRHGIRQDLGYRVPRTGAMGYGQQSVKQIEQDVQREVDR